VRSRWRRGYSSLIAVVGDVFVEPALVGHLVGVWHSADDFLALQPRSLRGIEKPPNQTHFATPVLAANPTAAFFQQSGN
jgi:hypothetical protein